MVKSLPSSVGMWVQALIWGLTSHMLQLSPCATTREVQRSPRLSQLEKAQVPQGRPSAAKKENLAFVQGSFVRAFPKAGTPGGHPHTLFSFLQRLLLGPQPCPYIPTIADNHFLLLLLPSMKIQIPGMYIYFQSPSDFFIL